MDAFEQALQSPQIQPDGSAVFTQDTLWEDWEFALAVPAVGGTPCTAKAVVVLETQDGLISRERVYYSADSLVDCGWAR